MGRDLTNLYISESFQYILQKSGSEVQNGLGVTITDLSASFATTSITSSLPLRGFVDVQVGEGSLTFTTGDGAETIVPISVTGSVSQSLSSSYASTADQVKVVNDTTNNARYVTYVDVTNGRDDLRAESQFTYNPSTNILTVGTVSGNLSGNATTATSASHAVQADNATNASTSSLSTYSQNTITTGKNLSGAEIAKGTPLYFTASGTSGNIVGVYPADAGNPNRMPAGGVAGETIANEAEGVVLLDGYIGGVNTSAFGSGDKVYVAVGGGYTNVAPTGSANKIQFLGNVEKSDSNGSGVIQMMGEERGLPNLAENNVWKGDANGVPQSVNQNTLSVKSAVSSSRPYVNVSAANVNYHLLYTTVNAGYKELLQETSAGDLTYNPSNNKLTVGNISATTLSGSLFGNATSANTASYVTEAVVAKTDKNNVFTGTQTFDNITVNGTGSFAYIQSVTGSAKIVGDAFVQVNTDAPALRYGGIRVVDSGSVAATASLQWDSESDYWMQVETTGQTAGLITGMSGSLGSEAFPTKNTIVKGGGGSQVTDSNITDDGSIVSINSTTNITGSLNGSGSIKINVPLLGNNTETHYIEQPNYTNSFGASYLTPWFGVQNYPAFGTGYENAFTVQYVDPAFSFAYYAEALFGPNRMHLQMNPSGSGGLANVGIQENNSGAQSVANIYADETHIGLFRGDVIIGNGSGNVSISGSVNVDQTITGEITNATLASTASYVAGNNVDGTVANATTAATASSVSALSQTVNLNGGLAVTGSFIVSGSGNNNKWISNWPSNFQTKTIWDLGPQTTADGVLYDNARFRIFNYGSIGRALNGWLLNFDGDSENYYSSFWHGPQASYFVLRPSGSAADSTLRLSNDSGDTTNFTAHADYLEIGSGTSQKVRIKGEISGSIQHEVAALSIASTTASIDGGRASYFTLALVSGSNTHVNTSNLAPGKTYIMRTTQPDPGYGTISFGGEIRFAGGTAPTATANAGAIDIYTFVAFDSSDLYATQVANLS